MAEAIALVLLLGPNVWGKHAELKQDEARLLAGYHFHVCIHLAAPGRMYKSRLTPHAAASVVSS